MTQREMDDFSDAGNWKHFASGNATFSVTSEPTGTGYALRLDFDFRGEKGFVGIRKDVHMSLPDSYSFSFRIRGDAPANTLEFKLTDRANRNVWRWQKEAFEFSTEGKHQTLTNRDVNFAWGPDGGGQLRRLGGVEFIITAGPGGKGTVWIDDFQFLDRTNRAPPDVTASSSRKGFEAALILHGDTDYGWRPLRNDQLPWLQFDFLQRREYGGLIIDWGPRPSSRQFAVQASDTSQKWKTIYQASGVSGPRSFIPLPNGESRFLRLNFQSEVDVRKIKVQPYDFTRSTNDFFHSVAKHSQKGSFPRYLLREQSYWTCVGVTDGKTCALINEEGLIEPDKGTFSLEPFLSVAGELITWADAKRKVSLESDDLPIPTVQWKRPELTFEITPFATHYKAKPVLFVRYRVTNASSRQQRIKLHISIRPHQVTPPWQSWKQLGGVSEIRDIARIHDTVSVNSQKVITPLSHSFSFGAMAFDHGILANLLAAGKLPSEEKLHDPRGLASAVLSFSLSIPTNQSREIFIAVPFGFSQNLNSTFIKELAQLDGNEQFQYAVSELTGKLNSVTFRVPRGLLREAVKTFRTAAGQILINRNGPALQPGPRRYTRCWIRDSAIMGTALLRAGERTALAENVRWYARYQRKDGFVPCCIDEDGADWLVEHDSHGQFIYSVMESFRFTHDLEFLKELWPNIKRAASVIDSLRNERLTDFYKEPEHNDCLGLLPESASHEGYLTQPVHSYWDDYWALRGLVDAASAATVLGYHLEAKQFRKLSESFRQSLAASIQRVINRKSLNYVPGSVEWADYDPTATANALMLFSDTADLPLKQLNAMYDQFVHDTLKKHSGEVPWNNYTAYEIRIIGALVRLGKRDDAIRLLEIYLKGRRPGKWHQWPEITWFNPRAPGHLGDLPHTWIAAEFILAFSAMFAYEREQDHSLVVGAGVDHKWLTGSGLAIDNLPNWYGSLDLRMREDATGALQIHIAGNLRVPAGGIIIRPPLDGPISHVVVNGTELFEFSENEATIKSFPADVLIRTATNQKQSKKKSKKKND